MKLKKKSGLIGVVVALSAASLISVGFASWVISQGDAVDVTGTIQVDTVSNKVYKINFASGVTGTTLNQKIVFGVDESTYTGTPWLTNTGTIGTSSDSSTANLVATFTFTIDNVTSATVTGNTATLNNADGATGYVLTATLASDAYDAALSDGLTYTDGNSQTHTYTDLVGAKPAPVLTYSGGTFTCTVTFTWGDDFDEKNPYQYFNEKPNNAANAEEAVNKLSALATLNATYTISLKVAIPTA